MLGSAMYGILSPYFEVVRIYRDAKQITLLDQKYPGAKKYKDVQLDLGSLYAEISGSSEISATKRVVKKLGDADYIINCAGIIRPPQHGDQSMTFFINSAFPHLLSAGFGDRLIHISTDCVFDGMQGAPYDELSPISPVDIYGLSKALGEPSAHSLVIRTSLIGMELAGKVSLLGWMLGQSKGKIIPGYTDHLWSGITTFYCAQICRAIISGKLHVPSAGLVHFFSEPVSKYQLLTEAAKRWRPDLTIAPVKSGNPVDRRLTSRYPFCADLGVPSLAAMLDDFTSPFVSVV